MRTLARLTLTLVALTTALAAAEPFTATGRAVMVGNREAARAQAVDSALRAMLNQAVKSFSGPAEGDDSATDENVYGRANTFTSAVNIVSERADGNVLAVELSADVDLAKLRQVVGGKRAPASKTSSFSPVGSKVLVLATEQIGATKFLMWSDVLWQPGQLSTKTTVLKIQDDSGGVEAVVSGAFANAGFTVVDPAVLRGKLAPKPISQVIDLGNAEAIQLARASDADFVVLVRATAKTLVNSTLAQGEMTSGQANLVGRVIRIKDGKVLASATQHAAQVHVDADTACIGALNEGAQVVADSLLQKLNSDQ